MTQNGACKMKIIYFVNTCYVLLIFPNCLLSFSGFLLKKWIDGVSDPSHTHTHTHCRLEWTIPFSMGIGHYNNCTIACTVVVILKAEPVVNIQGDPQMSPVMIYIKFTLIF